MRILIADDDRFSALVLGASLKSCGYDVTVVSDGLQAWEVLQSPDPPRLAILDWQMPGLDGLQVCRNIRKTGGAYIYVLLLTANTDSAEVVAGIDAGADDYIRKPFDPQELQARLRTGMRIVELEEKLRSQATHDSLTGLLNRATIIERVYDELQRASREPSCLSVAMADLDYFKTINDTYGHAAGDAVLSTIARTMRRALRPYDLLGRYGGEEFIIVFPRCDTSQAMVIAERLRRLVSAEVIDAGSSKVSITVSIGVADSTSFMESDSLIAAADAALFEAKRAGRNRVEAANPSFVKIVAVG